ncbi:hypothetical protein GOP47_0007406 [Adiantum capillus-veneris]|uniref:Uncharacterized protein n=1 Tax=Adiantum capillus-veneris TaxID=13818 RepID=A0A9D4V1G7_ADICA|nr:hypothetical protein GOP47_0007406 [Adiantum capillus-veneris]
MAWLQLLLGCHSSPSSGFTSSSTAEEVTQGIDASNLTAIVTGANSGLGEETARVLAMRGAQVVMAVRNVSSGETVKNSILEETNNARIHVLKLDLSSMASVRGFVSAFKALGLPLNILINNAGIMGCPFGLSTDGIELQFATNYIGPFLLTKLLLTEMKQTAETSGIEGRIVNMSSEAHRYTYWGGIRFDKLNEKSRYGPFLSYGQSKLGNVLHAKELARRLQEEGINITANSLHPGTIYTNIERHTIFFTWLHRCTWFLWKDVHQVNPVHIA